MHASSWWHIRALHIRPSHEQWGMLAFEAIPCVSLSSTVSVNYYRRLSSGYAGCQIVDVLPVLD